MKYEYLATDQALSQFCSDIADAPRIAFDTEFVSEDRYFPELCLIQVAAKGLWAIIDPLVVPDTQPFWNLLSAPGHLTIVHAGARNSGFAVVRLAIVPRIGLTRKLPRA